MSEPGDIPPESGERKKRGRPPLPPEKRKPRLSGSQRKHAAEAQHGAAVTEVKERARAVGVPLAGEWTGVDEFVAVGPPPLDNPETGLAWCRKILMVATHLGTTAPEFTLKERIRNARELTAVVGMTHPRARIESDLAKIKGNAKRRRDVGLEAVNDGGLARPATARGDRGNRGAGALPRPPLV